MSNISLLPNLDYTKERVKRLQEADEKLKLEQVKETLLESEKNNLTKELEDIALPKSAKLWILFSFLAIILGVINPLFFVYENNVNLFTMAIGFAGFMFSLVIMYYYFGFELRSEIGESKKQKEYLANKLWKFIRKKLKKQ